MSKCSVQICFIVPELLVFVILWKFHSTGTDANVFLTIFGDKDDTGEQHLKSTVDGKKDKFERGQTVMQSLKFFSPDQV